MSFRRETVKARLVQQHTEDPGACTADEHAFAIRVRVRGFAPGRR
jgi:hypothetical protein